MTPPDKPDGFTPEELPGATPGGTASQTGGVGETDRSAHDVEQIETPEDRHANDIHAPHSRAARDVESP